MNLDEVIDNGGIDDQLREGGFYASLSPLLSGATGVMQTKDHVGLLATRLLTGLG
jgi:hypothetical protein